MKAFKAWIEFGYNKEIWDSIENHVIFKLALSSTEDSEL